MDRKGEHARQPGQRRGAPLGEGGEQNLGITLGMEGPAQPLQLGAELAVVVELPVVDQRPAGRRRCHRLVAGGGEIEDREPPVAEPDAGRCPGSVRLGGRLARVVGTAVAQAIERPGERIPVARA